MSVGDIRTQIFLLKNDMDVMRHQQDQLKYQLRVQAAKVKDNRDKIKVNKTLPYLVATIVEILDNDSLNDGEERDEATGETTATAGSKSAVIKTTTRQTVFLPVIGLVDAEELTPGDTVGVNKDSFLVLEKLPDEFDSRVKAMEVDERPTEDFSDIGGCDKQIQELIEAVVMPMKDAHLFKSLGVQAPKGVLMWGPPGTGKTLLARACAQFTDAIFLKLAGPQLVQMFIGDGAKLVRDAFKLAKEKVKEEKRGGAIIFIDELDAVGTKRFGGGPCSVQRCSVQRCCCCCCCCCCCWWWWYQWPAPVPLPALLLQHTLRPFCDPSVCLYLWWCNSWARIKMYVQARTVIARCSALCSSC